MNQGGSALRLPHIRRVGTMIENLFWIGFVGAVLALGFAIVQARKVLKFPEGTEQMQKIAISIRKGANAYLKRQYLTVFLIFIIVFLLLLGLAYIGLLDNWYIPFAFLTGGVYSAHRHEDRHQFQLPHRQRRPRESG